MSIILRPTITATFLARVAENGDQAAFLVRKPQEKAENSWCKITFLEFYNRCKDLAFGLMSLNLPRHTRVILLSQTRLEWSLFDMAILGSGAIPVPISPRIVAQEMASIAEHCDASVAVIENGALLEKLLSGAQDPEAFRKRFSKIILIDPPSSLEAFIEEGLPLQKEDPDRFVNQLRMIQPSDLFTICYTSGTSGAPKGAMLTHDNLMSVLEDCVQLLAKHFTQSPRGVTDELALSFLPFSHAFGRVESMATYVFGWQEAFSRGPDLLLEDIQETRPTLLFAVPRIFEKAYHLILQDLEHHPRWIRQFFHWGAEIGSEYFHSVHSRKPPRFRTMAKYLLARKVIFPKIAHRFGGRLKFALCGGAPLPREVGEVAQILGLGILEGYGLTETCAPVTLNVPGQTRFGSVGKPLPEVTLKIDEDGEILVKSRKVFQGYYKDPEETRKVLQDGSSGGWLHTGDIGHIDREGFLRITDRKKDVIITSTGQTIHPQKIEQEIKKHPWITQAVAHGNNRSYLTALVTLDRNAVTHFAQEHRILFSEYAELIKNPRVLRIIQEILDTINQGLPHHSTIRKFLILPKEFTVEEGELTSALKVRRGVIDQKYREMLDSMYPAPPPPLTRPQ